TGGLDLSFHFSAKEIHQDLYPLFGRQDLCDHGPEPGEGASHDLYLIAFREVVTELFNLRGAYMISQLRQCSLFDSRIAIREPDYSAHTVSVPDPEVHLRELEVGKQIAGKHCLCDPDEALPASPF